MLRQAVKMNKLNKSFSTWLILLAISVNFLPSHGAPALEQFPEVPPSVRIIGGVKASPGEFPYIVSILNQGSTNTHACGGTLVSMSAVLTTVHCIELFRVRDIVVTAGAYFLDDARMGIQQTSAVRTITKFPGYTPTNHDIAVLHLTTPFIGNATVATIQLPRRLQESSGQCIIAGWGYTDDNNVYSPELMKGSISLNSKNICESRYPGQYDRNFQLCAGNMNGENVNPCIGDTGGPLICKNTDGSRYIAGVMSWGNGCGQPGFPSVSMEVSRYRDWLDTIINSNPPPTTTTTRKTLDE